MKHRRRVGRVIVLLLAILNGVGIGVILSLLADIQDTFGFPTWSLGVLAGVSFLTTFVAHLLFAPWADRGWERTVLFVGVAALSVSLLWMVAATELWQWIAARAMLGLAEGATVSSGRRVMLSWDQQRQGRALSLLTSGFLAGFLIGPPLGSLLNELNPDMPFLVPAIAALILFPFLAWVRPDEYDRPTVRLSRRRLAGLPGVSSALVIAACSWFMIGVLDAVWSRYITDLGGTTLVVGFGFLALASPSVLLTPVGGAMADRFHPIRLAMLSTFATAPVVLLFGFVPAVAAILVLAAAFSALWAFQLPTAQAAVAKVVPPSQAAEGQAILEGVGLIFAGVGAFLSAPLYGSGGPELLFVISSGVVLVAAVIVLSLRGRWVHLF